jgi:fatty acid desaturase
MNTSCLFSKYKNILGEPNTGIHSYRFMNIAIADVLLTILGSLAISYSFGVSFWKTLLVVFLFGIFLHRLFCVRTTLDMLIFS